MTDPRSVSTGHLHWIAVCLLLIASSATGEGTQESAPGGAGEADGQPKRELFRGKVVNLSEALAERDIRVAEEMDRHVALKTPDGELIPILADWRGRAFYQDKRLRDRDVELVGFRHPGIPYLQVLMVYTFNKEGERQYTDYWCDVCSIPMYEIKPCECCQGEIRLRFQTQDLPEYLQSGDIPPSSAP